MRGPSGRAAAVKVSPCGEPRFPDAREAPLVLKGAFLGSVSARGEAAHVLAFRAPRRLTTATLRSCASLSAREGRLGREQEHLFATALQ